MATAYPQWVDGGLDGNYGTTTNWSTGAVPDADDVASIDYSSRAITAGMDQSGVTFAAGSQLLIGPNFTGSIGTAASPLRLSAGTLDLIHVNAPLAQAINIRVGTCTNFIVVDGNERENGVHLVQGTATTLQVGKAGNFKLGALATATTARFGGAPNSAGSRFIIESGAVITTAWQFGGYVFNEAGTSGSPLVTVNVAGGKWEHGGTNTGTITTLNIYPGGYFYWTGYNAASPYTIGTINVYAGGVLDGSTNLKRGTATTINNYHGGSVILTPEFAVGTLNDYGGKYIGPTPTTRNTFAVATGFSG